MTATLAWINQSGGLLSDTDASEIVEALNLQAGHIAGVWTFIPAITNVFAGDGSDPTKIPDGAKKAYFLQNADVAGALGYHDVDPAGDPYIRVFVETCLSAGGSALNGQFAVSVCASHEMCEEAVDPTCSAQAADGQSRQWAVEVCDPCEGYSYQVTTPSGASVAVSDFVTPAFFRPDGTGVMDYDAKLSSPFTIAPGGYAIIGNQQVFGDQYPTDKLSDKWWPTARTYRRMHR